MLYWCCSIVVSTDSMVICRMTSRILSYLIIPKLFSWISLDQCGSWFVFWLCHCVAVVNAIITGNVTIPNICSIIQPSRECYKCPDISESVRAIVGLKWDPEDKLPTTFKRCSNQLYMENNYIPPVWFQAYIIPIFKKYVTTDPQNCRQIALT